MGGVGSGRHWHWDAKYTTGDYISIDVRRWKRDRLLTPNQSFDWKWFRFSQVVATIRVRTESHRVLLTYRHRRSGEDWESQSYPVYLDWTDCHLGGQRPWFLCPNSGCGRRVAILYSNGIFACRHCHQLAYESQRETPQARSCHKADNIREKLGWKRGILNGKELKPKWMHQKTFRRLMREYDDLLAHGLEGIPSRQEFIRQFME